MTQHDDIFQDEIIEEIEFSEDSLITATYDKIIQKLTFFEKIIHFFYKIFQKDKLYDFYKRCGLRQIEQELRESPFDWYDYSRRELTAEFAHSLFELIQALYILNFVFDSTITNTTTGKLATGSHPAIVEIAHHCIRNLTPLQQYVFTREQVVQMLRDVSPPELSDAKNKLIQQYFDGLSQQEIDYINDKYSELVKISKLTQVPLLEFLRRFNHAVDLTKEASTMAWTPVTITAIEYYIRSLYQAVQDLYLEESDLAIIKALNASLSFVYPFRTSNYTNDDIENSWKILLSTISKFQQSNILYKMLCLAQKNPAVNIPPVPYHTSIHEKFKETVTMRVSKMVTTIESDIYRKKMDDLMGMAIFNRIDHGLVAGVYSLQNSKQLEKISQQVFSYVYSITAIHHFMLNHVNTWFKPFLTSIATNGEFVDSKDLKQVEECYRSIVRFTHVFDKFVYETQDSAAVSQRIVKFIESAEDTLSQSDRQLLKVFVNSLNGQAKVVVDEFQDFFAVLKEFVDKFIPSYEKSDETYLVNIASVKRFIENNALEKLYDLYVFCQHVSSLLELENQRRYLRGNNE